MQSQVTGDNFFSGTTKRCSNEISLCWLEQKNGKLAFEISILVKNWKIHRFKKNVLAPLEIFFSWCDQEMRKREFLKLVGVRVEKKSLKYGKSGITAIFRLINTFKLGWLT